MDVSINFVQDHLPARSVAQRLPLSVPFQAFRDAWLKFVLGIRG